MTWTIVGGPLEEPPVGDHTRFVYIVEKADQRMGIVAELSGTLMASDPETLPWPLDEVQRTRGRVLVEQCLEDVSPPSVVKATSAGTTVA